MTGVSLSYQLNDLHKLLRAIRSIDYNQKSLMLGNNSIGQHVRHIIELIQGLMLGYEGGRINYDNRKRDLRLQTDRHFAMTWIEAFIAQPSLADKPLILVQENDPDQIFHTSYLRELLYNTEHAIHHMALIRVALREMKLDVVDEQFGVAPATIKYLEKVCVQ